MEDINIKKITQYAEDSLKTAENALDSVDKIGMVNAYGNYMFEKGMYMMALNVLRMISMENFTNVYHKTIDKNVDLLFRSEDLYCQLKALSTNMVSMGDMPKSVFNA